MLAAAKMLQHSRAVYSFSYISRLQLAAEYGGCSQLILKSPLNPVYQLELMNSVYQLTNPVYQHFTHLACHRGGAVGSVGHGVPARRWVRPNPGFVYGLR